MDRRPRISHQRASEPLILYARPLFGERSKSNTSTTPTHKACHGKIPRMTSPKELVQETRGSGSQSLFLDKLPLEVRNTVYSYIWAGEGRDHHIFHRKNRLFHARCVMDPLDEKEPDLIQKEMDRIYDMRVADKSRQAALQMWHKRLSSGSWGHRHWRCQERLDVSLLYGASDFLERDETSWMSMLLVCKQMYERHVGIIWARG